jgi:hypothetical protein
MTYLTPARFSNNVCRDTVWKLNLHVLLLEVEHYFTCYVSKLPRNFIIWFKEYQTSYLSNAENLTSNPKIRNSTARHTLGVSVRKADVLVLCRTVVLADFEYHIKLKNVVRGNAELMYDMTCGTYSYHCGSKGVMFLASC